MFGTCTRAAGSLSPPSDAGRVLGFPILRRTAFFGTRAKFSTVVCRGRDLKRRLQTVPTGTTCVLEVNQNTFETEVLKSEKVVLVDFWAEWCGPCKLVAPLLPVIEKEFGGSLKVVKIETDPSPILVEKYKVHGLPTLALFKDGKLVEGSLREGALAKKPLLEYLQKFGLTPGAS
eukprot:jgi/Botrbrau1/180/Bobra.0022s0160.1